MKITDQGLKSFIPDYWEAELERKIEKIHENQIKAGSNSACFALISDIHLAANSLHSAALLERVLNECNIPYYFDAGDFVSGKAYCPAQEIIDDIKSTQWLFSNILHKRLAVQGNHDAVFSTMPEPYAYAESISKSAVYNYIYRYLSSYQHISFDSSGMSYFADDIFHKTRYIALNTHNVPSDEKKEKGLQLYNKSCSFFTQEQIDWFSAAALNVPTSDWSVVICTHEIFNDSYPDPRGYGIILDILDAFRRHDNAICTDSSEGLPWENKLRAEVDFRGRGGDVIAWVGGHLHYDTIERHRGTTVLSTINDSFLNSKYSNFTHERGTITEQAFDVFTIDKNIGRVYVTRIGCGEDRVFDYR